MRRTDHFELAALSESLPHDLLHSHIIPIVLSEHLHMLLVSPIPPNWHPFFTLPLVSLAFHQTCRSLCVSIFGLEKHEDASVIDDILSFAQSLWTQAKRPPDSSQRILEYTYAQLMSGNSLIRIYMCIALARSFLNLDVLMYLAPVERTGQFMTLNHDDAYGEDTWGDIQAGTSSERLRMPDEKMHRVFLPLTCAMKLCDSIRPERLAYTVADYLANIVPFYSSVPLMLKYTQDLESYVTKEHRIEIETWVKWTLQTLGLIEEIDLLIIDMQGMGKLVKLRKRNSCIPWDVLQVTGIIGVLRDVLWTDWGYHSEEIRTRAAALLNKWIHTH